MRSGLYTEHFPEQNCRGGAPCRSNRANNEGLYCGFLNSYRPINIMEEVFKVGRTPEILGVVIARGPLEMVAEDDEA